MNNSYNRNISQAIENYLNDEEFKFYFDPDKGIFRMGMSVIGKLRSIQYTILVHETDFTVYGISPISADEDDEDMITRIAIYICETNYGLRNGCFELDRSDGELRVKSYVDCDGLDAPSTEMIQDAIICPTALFSKYGNGLLDIIFSSNGKDSE